MTKNIDKITYKKTEQLNLLKKRNNLKLKIVLYCTITQKKA